MSDPADFTQEKHDSEHTRRGDAADEAREDVNDAFDTQEPGVEPEPLTESTDGGLDGGDPGVEE
ncbi:hypothetical protein [Agromyces larvae]|uniref:Autophagy-related protein 2 n=1 Tax=Agromyces larvae TaxID=2929802 RepID=A0ABY4BYU5_9MICO|nr:hypothetical protein [Agromyces larvae]UOE42898.1 hypothetical protein MTO99_11940 [Agromyces larvae]